MRRLGTNGCEGLVDSSRRRQQRVGHRDGEPLSVDLDDDLVSGVRRFSRTDRARVFFNRVVELGFDPTRVNRERCVAVGSERGVVDDELVERKNGRESDDLEFAQRPPRFREGVLAVGSRDNQFREQRIERTRDDVTGDDTGVDADSGTAGNAKCF